MLDYAGYDGLYSFGVSSSSWYDGLYSFSVTEFDYADLKDTYTYYRDKGDRCDPQVGYWSPFAPVVGGEFPFWHAARSNQFSRTQRLINVWAQPIWEFDQLLQYERRNRFISTVDMFQPDASHRVPVTVELHNEGRNVVRPKNLLRNPDFSIPALARYNMPWRWTDRFTATTGTVTHYPTNSLVGYGSVRMFAANGKNCYLRQNVLKTFGVNDSVTGSAWVLIPITENTSEEDSTKRALVLTALYADGTCATSRTALPSGTAGSWRRISCTLTPTKRVARIDFLVVIENDLGHDYEVFVDACQLELGKAATSFERRLDESPFWMVQNGNQVPYFIEALGAGTSRQVEHVSGDQVSYTEYERYRIWPTGDQHDWWLNALPTRVDTPTVDASGLQSTVRTRYGFHSDVEDRSRRAAKFQISSDKGSIEWVVEDTPIDVIFSYAIGDHFMDGGNFDEYGVPGEEDGSYDITIEALTVHKDLVWVVALETWNGTTIRVLKVLRPFQRPDILADNAQVNFLENIQDYNLGLSTGTVSAIGFAEGDDTKLLLTLDGTEYVAQLWYDYAFFDREVATSTLLRHNYQGQDLVMR